MIKLTLPRYDAGSFRPKEKNETEVTLCNVSFSGFGRYYRMPRVNQLIGHLVASRPQLPPSATTDRICNTYRPSSSSNRSIQTAAGSNALSRLSRQSHRTDSHRHEEIKICNSDEALNFIIKIRI